MSRRWLHRTAAVVGLAAVRVRRTPRRSLLAITGIALAVLSVTVLASVGAGVVETGQQKFDQSGRDLWVSGGPLELQPSQQSPVTNGLVDSHTLAADLRERDGVAVAQPLAFQAIYVGRTPDDLQLLTGAGLEKANRKSVVSITDGEGLDRDDPHYGNGSYDGPMTNEVLVDPRTAAALNVSVGETLYIGGSRASARDHRFTVAGISPTFSKFLGSKSVVLYLSELQEVTGTTGADRAAFVTVRLDEDADTQATKRRLEQAYPDLETQTNREKFRGIVRGQGLLIGSAVALVVLAVVSGFALTVNLLFLSVSQQRQELATLRVTGLRPRLLAELIGSQGLILGTVGGLLGLAATPVAVAVCNRIVARLVGFESLLVTPPALYFAGGAIAVGIGTASAVAAGWYLGRSVTLRDITSA